MGSAIAVLGEVIGSFIMFGMARYGFSDWAERFLAKRPKVKEFERFFEEKAFINIFIFRAVPILPPQVINVISGVSNVNWLTFILATILGRIPGVHILTMAGRSFTTNKTLSFIIYGIYLLCAIGLFFYWKKWKQQEQVSQKI